MKPELPLIALLALSIALAGCASSPPKPKATLERGWIGGDFRAAGKELRPPGKDPKVYIRQVFSDTPTAMAGFRSGDLILAVEGTAVTSLGDFRRRIDAAPPGHVVSMRILREGQEMDVPVTIGRERYQRWKSLIFGLGLTTELDLLPNPNFWLGPVGGYKRTEDRKDLNSPESKLERAAQKTSENSKEGVSSGEGWNVWLAVMGFSGYKVILSQESVVAP